MIVCVDAGQVNLTEVYTLNRTAAGLWQWAQDREFTAAEMVDRVCECFEVERTVAEKDVERMLADWQRFALVEA